MYFTIYAFASILLGAMLLELFLQKGWMRWMRAHKIQQVTKMYGPSWHEKTKTGTPTMGGVVFIPAFFIPFLLFVCTSRSGALSHTLLLYSYPLVAAFVGLIDDYMKFKKQDSDGISSRQKLFLQVFLTFAWAYFAIPETLSIMPGVTLPPLFTLLLVTFFGVGIQNAVNVTDGLDGLATGCALISFFCALLFLSLGPGDMAALAAGCGICLGFMWHNANPASVFMGDVGAHFLGGLLLSVCVASGSFLFIIPLSFMFGIEMISVTLQIFTIRVWNKRFFLMAPIHHHFEKKGWSEPQIVTRFWVAHMVGIFTTISLFTFLFLSWKKY